jgi:hypothetical protein
VRVRKGVGRAKGNAPARGVSSLPARGAVQTGNQTHASRHQNGRGRRRRHLQARVRHQISCCSADGLHPQTSLPSAAFQRSRTARAQGRACLRPKLARPGAPALGATCRRARKPAGACQGAVMGRSWQRSAPPARPRAPSGAYTSDVTSSQHLAAAGAVGGAGAAVTHGAAAAEAAFRATSGGLSGRCCCCAVTPPHAIHSWPSTWRALGRASARRVIMERTASLAASLTEPQGAKLLVFKRRRAVSEAGRSGQGQDTLRVSCGTAHVHQQWTRAAAPAGHLPCRPRQQPAGTQPPPDARSHV